MGRGWAAWLTACGLVAAPVIARAEGYEARQRRVTSERSALVQVARNALPAVVSITTQEHPEPGAEPQKGIGSGFIISADGYVLTASHGVEDAVGFTVPPPDAGGWARERPAPLVGSGPPTD